LFLLATPACDAHLEGEGLVAAPRAGGQEEQGRSATRRAERRDFRGKPKLRSATRGVGRGPGRNLCARAARQPANDLAEPAGATRAVGIIPCGTRSFLHKPKGLASARAASRTFQVRVSRRPNASQTPGPIQAEFSKFRTHAPAEPRRTLRAATLNSSNSGDMLR